MLERKLRLRARIIIVSDSAYRRPLCRNIQIRSRKVIYIYIYYSFMDYVRKKLSQELIVWAKKSGLINKKIITY